METYDLYTQFLVLVCSHDCISLKEETSCVTFLSRKGLIISRELLVSIPNIFENSRKRQFRPWAESLQFYELQAGGVLSQ